jgi:hypothetical protein
MALSVHNGWHIRHSSTAPPTGQWQATRHGVSMCAGTSAALLSMIDQRTREDRARREDASIGLRPSWIEPLPTCCYRAGAACWNCPRRKGASHAV